MRITKRKNVPRPGGNRGKRSLYYPSSVESFLLKLHDRTFRDVLRNIYTSATNLPRPIRRVCYVQLFAFMGWSVIRFFDLCKAMA